MTMNKRVFFGLLLMVISPYVYGMTVLYAYLWRGYYAIGGEVFLPIIAFLIAYYTIFGSKRGRKHEEQRKRH